MFEWFFFVCGTFAVTIIKILEIPFTVFFRCTRINNYWSKVLFIQCCFGHRKVSQLNQNVEKKHRQLKAFKQSSTLEQTPFHEASIQCLKLSKLVYWSLMVLLRYAMFRANCFATHCVRYRDLRCCVTLRDETESC